MSGESSQTRMAGFQSAGAVSGRGADRRPASVGCAGAGRRRPVGRCAPRPRRATRDRFVERRRGRRRHGQQEARAGADASSRRGSGRRPSGAPAGATRSARARSRRRGPPTGCRTRTPRRRARRPRARCPARCPRPRSRARRHASATSMRMCPCSVNLAALATRLRTIWRTRSSSISSRSGTCGVDLRQDRDAFAARQAVDRRDDVADHLAHRGRLRIGGEVAGRQPRVVEQVVDQAQQVRAVADDDLRVLVAVVRTASRPGRAAG